MAEAARPATARRPQLSNAGLSPTHDVEAINERNESVACSVADERPLTLYLDKREIVTLMTLGGHPEYLTLGYLRNQGLIADIGQIAAVQVDWESEAVAVTTRAGEHIDSEKLEQKLSKRTVTTGCGQGTVFGDLMAGLQPLGKPSAQVKQSTLYALLQNLNDYNEIYRSAGAVHGCALCRGTEIIDFVEDIGRHNAVDAIAGRLWYEDATVSDCIFYTTGRLTSEMVIKVAQMRIPLLLSRSGLTHMGLRLATELNITLIARARGQRFMVYHGAERIAFDAIPPLRPGDRQPRG